MTEAQSASAVMMIRPVQVSANPLTVATNAFQKNDIAQADGAILDAAQQEFDNLVQKLTQAGVLVCVFDDTEDSDTPDSVFPNNWITTHADGTVVLYPMMAANRRAERRPELIDRLCKEFGFEINTIIDFSPFEIYEKNLEGTGSMILDRINRIVYACRSSRTHPDTLDAFCERFDFRAVLFDAVDRNGMAIYHTNVMMTLGSRFAVLCAESVRDQTERAELLDSLTSTGHEVVEISHDQMEAFAGNMLELRAGNGHIVVMSQRAHDSLSDTQISTLKRHAEIVSSPINTLEDYGGGSVRCMLAEIFLPSTKEHDD